MRCDDIRQLLEDCREAAVPELLRSHLAACKECAEWWRDWLDLGASFKALAAEPVPEPSLGFAARVQRRLEEDALPGWGADFFERAGRRAVWATLLVALTVLLALVLPSTGPVRGPGEFESLLAQPSMASVSSDPFVDLDSSDFIEPAPAGAEREKK
jgi:hypothetical protein